MVVERIEVEAVFKDLASRDASKMAKVFTDEVERALDAAESTAVEFGATADQLPKIFKAIDKAAKETGRTFAEAAKAFEKLVDESEDTEFALNNVSGALRRADIEGKKVEDSAREIGQNFRAQRGEISRTNVALNTLAEGFAGVSAAALAFATDSLQKAIEKNVEAKQASDDLTAAVERLQLSVGNAIIKHGEFTATTGEMTSALNDLDAIVNTVSEDMGWLLTAVELVGSGILGIISWPLALASAFSDVSTELRAAAQGARIFMEAFGAKPGEVWSAGAGRDAGASLNRSATGKAVVGFGMRQFGRAGQFLPAHSAPIGPAPPPTRSGGGGGGRRQEQFLPTAFGESALTGGSLGGLGLGLSGQILANQAASFYGFAGARSGVMGAAGDLGAGVGDVQALAASQEFIDALERATRIGEQTKAWVMDVNGAFVDLANDGIGLVVSSLGSMVEAAAAGELSLSSLGTGLLTSMGDMLVQFGQGLMLAALGVQALETGILSPGAAIAIAAGAIAAGAAMKGFARRGQNQPTGGGSAAAVGSAERRFDRLQNRPEDRESRVVYLNVDGRQMQSYLTDTANDGLRRGRISTTPRRAT